LAALSGIAIAILSPAAEAAPRKVDVPLYGYSLVVPDGWQDAPDSVFGGMVGSLGRRGAVPDLAFMRTGPKPAEQPAIVVLRVDLATLGNVDFGDLRKQADSFARDSTRQMEAMTRGARGLVKSVKIGAPVIDEATRSFGLAIRMEFQRAGIVAFRIRGFVGRNHLILVYMFAGEAHASAGESAFSALTASFRFTPEAAHPHSVFAGPARANAAVQVSGGPSVLEMGMVGGLVLLSLGCVVYLIAQRRRRDGTA